VGEKFPLQCPACGGDIRLRGDGRQEQAAAGLIGQAKKKNPNANPGKVRQMCLDLIKAM
jgi:hypothetical protein